MPLLKPRKLRYLSSTLICLLQDHYFLSQNNRRLLALAQTVPHSATAPLRTMADATGDNLRSLIFKVDDDGRASLSVLDQLLLPHVTKYVPILNVEDAWDAVSPRGGAAADSSEASPFRILASRPDPPPPSPSSPRCTHRIGNECVRPRSRSAPCASAARR